MISIDDSNHATNRILFKLQNNILTFSQPLYIESTVRLNVYSKKCIIHVFLRFLNDSY